ncbi:MAG TPA: hypothetical protein VK641_16160, partial [Terriglobales bacterium]|nr:hypothetical protein [Terriglobales bacterium]
ARAPVRAINSHVSMGKGFGMGMAQVKAGIVANSARERNSCGKSRGRARPACIEILNHSHRES